MDVFIKFAINFAVSNQKKQQVMKKVKLLFILSLLFCLVPRAITKNTSLNAVQERNISLSESWEVVRGLPSVEASINYEEELLYVKFNITFDNVNIEIKDAHNTVLVHDLVHPIENMTYTISMKGLPLNKGYKLHIHNQYGEATGLFFL
ncbi:DUF3244 domain-containing protein [Bacteroides sp. ZJ-18]|uniref:DUF3244 domain-containing protein n=2 Tax=unclassified Bacteroides TaxID=2646097 RepID=UPI0013EDE877|nr:DUF3244 domain-containing protein [Bacteroides sp. ZJ-18]QTO26550.1 DUF3244 domain-containing protein [Bacteroides sp. ZJ-18]